MNASDPTIVDGKRPYPTRAILYPDGRVVKREAKISMADIEAIICDGITDRPRNLCTVNLRDGHVALGMCHRVVCLPSVRTASYNVAVAGALVMFDRYQKGLPPCAS